jgi:hypothetical protein
MSGHLVVLFRSCVTNRWDISLRCRCAPRRSHQLPSDLSLRAVGTGTQRVLSLIENMAVSPEM